jgi:Protein of unknown function (DUF2510)
VLPDPTQEQPGDPVARERKPTRHHCADTKGVSVAITVEQAKLRRANRILGWGVAVVALGLLVTLPTSWRLLWPVPVIAGIVLMVVGWQLRSSAADEQPLTIAPGWYDDPEAPNRLRYYDGATWTDRTAAKE